jgi:hypothetical protein
MSAEVFVWPLAFVAPLLSDQKWVLIRIFLTLVIVGNLLVEVGLSQIELLQRVLTLTELVLVVTDFLSDVLLFA